jgi:hypothetical protein
MSASLSIEEGVMRQRLILLAYWVITFALTMIVIAFALR